MGTKNIWESMDAAKKSIDAAKSSADSAIQSTTNHGAVQRLKIARTIMHRNNPNDLGESDSEKLSAPLDEKR